MKTLYVFAHKGEAQCFAERLKPGDDLFICAEGCFEALMRLSFYLGSNKNRFDILCNAGVCASLTDTFKRGSLHAPFAFYGARSTSDFYYSSFSSAAPRSKGEILSVDKRVHSEEDRRFYSMYADLLDRESYACAKIAKYSGLAFVCCKIVSDFAQSSDASFCENIRSDALSYSRDLYEFHLDHVEDLKNKILRNSQKFYEAANLLSLLNPNFYFTKAMRDSFHKKILGTDNKYIEKKSTELKALKLTPKDRALRLLTSLDKN